MLRRRDQRLRPAERGRHRPGFHRDGPRGQGGRSGGLPGNRQADSAHLPPTLPYLLLPAGAAAGQIHRRPRRSLPLSPPLPDPFPLAGGDEGGDGEGRAEPGMVSAVDVGHGGGACGVQGIGGCSSFDVVSMLKKSKQDLIDCEVEISAERADSEPKVFTKIHLHFIVSGNDLSEKRVARAIELSAEKYCSASIMLGKTADVTHDFVIV